MRRATVQPSDSDEPMTEFERSSLMVDGLWDDAPYPEFSQDAVLRAYRLGFEDGAR